MATVAARPSPSTAPAPSTPKPLAAHPTFPLSPLDLARWNRFAKKGGIGAARALRDKVSEDGGVKDLMLLEGDEVIVLMEMGGEVYLGYCEGVVGLFHGREVQMLQAKLKRPVISSRPTTTTSSGASTLAPYAAPAPVPAPAPAPSFPRTLPRAQTSLDVRAPSPSASSSFSSHAAPPPSKRLSRSSSFDSSPLSLPTSSTVSSGKKPLPLPLPTKPRRKPVPEVEVLSERFAEPAGGGRRERKGVQGQGDGMRGLGIDVAAAAGAGAGVAKGAVEGEEQVNGAVVGARGTRRSKSVSEIAGEVQALIFASRSPDLAGAFSPTTTSSPLAPTPCSTPYLTSSSSSSTTSSAPSSRLFAPSPAPSFSSSTGTATSTTTRTPSLITSPYSDFGSGDRSHAGMDSDTGSSAGHGSVLATPDMHHQYAGGGSGWEKERNSVLTLVGPIGEGGAEGEDGGEGGTTEYLDYRFASGGEGCGDGPTPTVEKFPMPQTGLRFPPLFADIDGEEGKGEGVGGVAPTPASSPSFGRGDATEDGAGLPPPTPMKDYAPSLLGNISPSSSSALLLTSQQQQQLKSQFSVDTLSSTSASLPFSRPTSLLPTGLPSAAAPPRSAFSSFSPSSSLVSSHSASILSATDYASHRNIERTTKSSTSTNASTSSSTTSTSTSTTPAAGTTPSGSVPGTPYGEDPTLAFIFDSYAYSYSSNAGSTAGSESGWSTPAGVVGRAPIGTGAEGRREEGYFPYQGEAAEEEEEEEEEEDLAAALPPTSSSSATPASPVRAFGAASQLRSQIRFAGPPTAAALPAPPTHTHAHQPSDDDGTAQLHIPRLSSIFPRSTTDDSLASFAPSVRSYGSEGEGEWDGGRGAERAFGMTARRILPALSASAVAVEREEKSTPPAVPTVRRNNTVPPSSSSPPPSPQPSLSPTPPRSRSYRRARSSSASSAVPLLSSVGTVPVANRAHLAADLDASRRLFQAHFPPPREELVQAATTAGALLSFGALPESPVRAEAAVGRMRRKSAKGLQISAPVVRGLGLGLGGLSAVEVPHSAPPGVPSMPVWRSQHVESPVRQVMRRRGSEQEQAEGMGEGEGEDVFVASPTSTQLPQLEIVGASPAAAARYIPSSHYHAQPRPSLDASFQYPRPSPTTTSPSLSVLAAFPSTSATSTPSSTSHQTFASAQSSPMTDRSSSSQSVSASEAAAVGGRQFYYPTPPTSAATFSGSFATSQAQAQAQVGPNKLRKAVGGGGLTKMKSSPSLASFASANSAGGGVGGTDPFVDGTSPRLGGLFSRSSKSTGKDRERSQASPSASSSSPTLERKVVDYSAGISNKDFEEETVQIGKNAFEMVKPLAVALLGTPELGAAGGGEQAEEEERSSASLDGGAGLPRKLSLSSSDRPRPSMDSDLATPLRRPPPPSHMLTTTSAYSAQTAYTFPSPNPNSGSNLSAPNANTGDFSRSALSLSHFSPATPSSVEDGGRSSVSDHRAREQKWLQVLSGDGMTPAQAKKKKALRALVHSGVPSSVRGKVWAFLAEAECRVGVYQTLCELDHLPPSPAIEHDLDTMLLDHPQFGPGTAGRDDLESVLRAFSRYDQQLGYYPGLANVVALLLTQMPAESAFWTLCSLVRNYGFKQFFPSSKEELRLEVLAFGFLLEGMEPKLAKRLRDLSITPSDFLPIWLSTLFLSILPLPTTLRLIDLLLFDPKTRYRVPLALLDLSHLEDTVAFPTRDSVLNHLLAPPPEAFTPALLVPAVATMKLSDDKLKKAYKKAAQAMLKPQVVGMR